MRRIKVGNRFLLVNNADYDFVRSHTLSMSGGNDREYVYAYRSGYGDPVALHRLIAARAGLPLDGDIDHKDQNKLDCRRRNLRPATRTQNFANRPKYRNNSTGFKGVIWNKQRGKFQARLTKDRRQVHLGFFDDPALAYKAYTKAAKRHFGEFAAA